MNKDNIPACVLLNPDKYESMIEALEDYALYFEAERRMESAKINGFVSEILYCRPLINFIAIKYSAATVLIVTIFEKVL